VQQYHYICEIPVGGEFFYCCLRNTVVPQDRFVVFLGSFGRIFDSDPNPGCPFAAAHSTSDFATVAGSPAVV